MSIRLGLLDKNISYSVGLMTYMNEYHRDDIQVMSFSNIKEVEKYMENQKLDGLLLESGIDTEAHDVKKIFLVEEETENSESIYKYQSLENIFESIIQKFCHAKKTKRNLESIVAVCSPVGRCGKTSYAKDISQKSKRGIYVCWEYFVDNTKLGPEYKRMCEEFMYYLVEKNPKLVELVNDMLVKREADKCTEIYVDFEDVSMIDADHLSWLKELIVQSECGIKFVFDIGLGTINNMRILDSFDTIYVPFLANDISRNKIEDFKKFIRSNGMRYEAYKFIDMTIS